jgi:hypothetical protein
MLKEHVRYVMFLPIPEIESFQDEEGLRLCRQVEGATLEDFQGSYQCFSTLSFHVWQRIRFSFIQDDSSLDCADIPSRMQEKHLVHAVMYLDVCIHVLCYEAMGKETGTLHLYIYRQ